MHVALPSQVRMHTRACALSLTLSLSLPSPPPQYLQKNYVCGYRHNLSNSCEHAMFEVPSNSTSPECTHTAHPLNVQHSLGLTLRFPRCLASICCHLPSQMLLEVPMPRTWISLCIGSQSLLSPQKPTFSPSLHILSPKTRPCSISAHPSCIFSLFLSLDSHSNHSHF